MAWLVFVRLQQMDIQLTHLYQARICLCVCLVASTSLPNQWNKSIIFFFSPSSSIFSINKFKLHGKSRIGVTVLGYGFSFRFMWAPYSSIIILCVVVVTRRKKKYGNIRPELLKLMRHPVQSDDFTYLC